MAGSSPAMTGCIGSERGIIAPMESSPGHAPFQQAERGTWGKRRANGPLPDCRGSRGGWVFSRPANRVLVVARRRRPRVTFGGGNGMFSHVMVGSNDIARSKKFYDALFGAMGGKPGVEDAKGRLIYQHNGGLLLVGKPIDGKG